MKENGMQELAIYVSSFDGYKDLWDTFFRIFDTYWPECSVKIYLVTNEEDYIRKNVTVLNTGPEKNWFFRTKVSLHQVTEKYILFMLEDYFISKKIQEKDIFEIISYMKTNKVYYYRLSKSKLKEKGERVLGIPAGTAYPISLQPAIWEKEQLLRFLNDIDKSSPWDFETYFVEKYKNSVGQLQGICYDNRDLLGYKNGVLRGKWIPSTLRYYRKQGIIINTNKRCTLSKSMDLKFRLSDFVSGVLSYKNKEKIKKVLRFLHIDYL